MNERLELILNSLNHIPNDKARFFWLYEKVYVQGAKRSTSLWMVWLEVLPTKQHFLPVSILPEHYK